MIRLLAWWLARRRWRKHVYGCNQCALIVSTQLPPIMLCALGAALASEHVRCRWQP